MSTPGDIDARIRAIHAARAEVDEMLGFGPAPAAPAPRAPMTLDAYQRAAARTGGSDLRDENLFKGLSCAALGLTGEAGEVADLVKKVVHHRHPLDAATREKLVKELGDVLWYVAHAASVLGVTLDHVAAVNVEKLQRRYPNGFETARSLSRTEEG